MDAPRFDLVAHGVARRGTCRETLAGLAGLAGAIALRPAPVTAACQTCPEGSRSCGRKNRCFRRAGGRNLVCNANQGGRPECCTNAGRCTTVERFTCPGVTEDYLERGEPCFNSDIPCCGTDICPPDGEWAPCIDEGGTCTLADQAKCRSRICNVPSGQSFGTCTPL